MILSNLWPGTLADRFLSTISVGGFAASNWMLFKAMSHWLGPRFLERTVKLLIYLIPVGYCILFDDYSIRVGWANFLLRDPNVSVGICVLSTRQIGARRLATGGRIQHVCYGHPDPRARVVQRLCRIPIHHS